MPTVPIFQETDPGVASVSPTSLPAVKVGSEATAETFGAGNERVQSAVEKNVEVINSISDQEKDRANKLASIVMARKLSDLETSIQDDPQKGGVLALKGQDALHAPEVAQDLWKKGTDDISKLATNPTLLAFYKEREGQHWQNLNSNVQKHMASEQFKFANEESAAAVKGEQDAAALNYSDPDRPAQAIANQTDTILKWAKINGIPANSPIIDEKIDDAMSKTFIGMTQSMVANKDFKTARGFLKANQDKISPPSSRITLENEIKQGEIYSIVQQVSEEADSMRLSNGDIDKTRLNDAVKGMKLPPDQEYAVMTHVDRLAAVDHAERIQRDAANQTEFVNKLIEAQSQGVPYDQALKLASQYGKDAMTVAQFQADVAKVYASPQDKFSSWITRQPQATQTAWAQAESMVAKKYPTNLTWDIGGNRVSAQKEALAELKTAVLGKNSDQIRDIATEKLKDVPNPNAFTLFGVGLWNRTKPSLYMDAEKEQMIGEAYAKIEKDFNTPEHPDAVSQARAWLATHKDKDGKPFVISPLNLKIFLEEHRNGTNEPQK